MGRSIEDAMSYEATRRASVFKSERALSNPPECLGWTRDQWDTLSEGYKREIERDLRRRGEIADPSAEGGRGSAIPGKVS